MNYTAHEMASPIETWGSYVSICIKRWMLVSSDLTGFLWTASTLGYVDRTTDMFYHEEHETEVRHL